MSKGIRTLALLVLLIPGAFPCAQEATAAEQYQKAYRHERAGEYGKAEAIYEKLYEANPSHFNYFSRYKEVLARYKEVLARQRKFREMIPLLEARIDRRGYDHYFRLELGLLYYAVDERTKALAAWEIAFRGKHESIRRNYAGYIYRYVLEYGLGSRFYGIASALRDMTGIDDLLAEHVFGVCVQYRDWEHAAAELREIAEKHPRHLRHVKRPLFRLPPDSPLYGRIIPDLRSDETSAVRILLSEIYTQTGKADSALSVLSPASGDAQLLEAMRDLARRMFSRENYRLARQASERAARQSSDARENAKMLLLAARAYEEGFYRSGRDSSFIPDPYASAFTGIRFRSYDMRRSAGIERALAIYDSLRTAPPAVSADAAFRHAEILYRVYHDLDRSLQEFREMAATAPAELKVPVLTRISDLLIAREEYDEALDHLRHAPAKHRLMVHEEDRLMPQLLYATFMAGELDSLNRDSREVLALLPAGDDLYNDVLNFTGFLNAGLRDTLRRDSWLEAERMLAAGRLSRAADLYLSLLATGSPARALYGIRCLDILHVLDDLPRERDLWDTYYGDLLDTEAADLFMLKYARFQERTQNFKKAVELYEEYLLSYRESMYYETVRKYMREINQQVVHDQ